MRSPPTPSPSGGYAAGVEAQSSPRNGESAPPRGCCRRWSALIAIVIMFFYPLTDARHRQIVTEIAERREANGADGEPIDPALSTAAFRAADPQSGPPTPA